MRRWLIDHVLEAAALLVAIFGGKGVSDFWAEIVLMFTEHTAPAIFVTALAAAVGALVACWAMRAWARKELGARDENVTSLRAELDRRPTPSQVDERDGKIRSLEGEVASLRSDLSGRPTREQMDERDERIASLETELLSRPTVEQLDEARAALDERPTRAELDAERAISSALRAELETRPTRDQWVAANELIEHYKKENEGLKNADADKLDSFSLAQLVLMQKVLRAMDEGRYLVARSGSSDSDVGSQLAERDVLDWAYDGEGGGSYSMRPEWVSFMRRNGERVEARISELCARAGIVTTPSFFT